MATTATPQPGSPVDPYRAYNFKLLNVGSAGHFTAVSGLEVNVARLLYREAGDDRVRCIPGQVDLEPVTLHFGLTSSRELWDWLVTAMAGKVVRRNVSVALMDATGTVEVLRWNMIAAWPTRWRGAHLNTLSQEIAIESLTLAYEQLELVTGSAAAPTAS